MTDSQLRLNKVSLGVIIAVLLALGIVTISYDLVALLGGSASGLIF